MSLTDSEHWHLTSPQHVACEHSHSGKAHVHFALVNVAVNGNLQNAVYYIYRNTQSKQ